MPPACPLSLATRGAACVCVVMALSGCEIRVHKDDDRRPDTVRVDTPLGDVDVRTDVQASDVGLPIYPGARRVNDPDDGHGSANVSVDSPFGEVSVAALKLESDDAPDAVVAYYERELRTYGAVTVCRGNIDFDKPGGTRPPQCRERRGTRQVDVAAGTEDDFHMASVSPRGSGAQFALVAVRTSR